MLATMDHAHIRGLVTGISSFRRGAAYALVSGIIASDAHVARSRVPLIGPAHRVAPVLLGIILSVLGVGLSPLVKSRGGVCLIRSCTDLHLASNVPNKARQLPCNRHADLVLMELAGAQVPIALRKSQLRSPGDLAHEFRLALLADLQQPTD